MVSRCIIRPSEGIFNQLCYASFVKKYQLLTKQVENDSQPNELSDEVIEENHSMNDNNSYPKRITLSTGEKLVHRKVEFVLRHRVPNKDKDPEAYAHHLLFMFYPFRSEEQLKARELLSYSAKLLEAEVINVVNENKSLVEPFSDIVDEAFLHFRSDLTPSWDPFLQQENGDVNNELLERENIEEEQSDDIQSSDTPHAFSRYAATSTQISTVLTDTDLSQKIRSLNLKQRQVFDFAYNWVKSYIISKSAYGRQVPVPLHLFLSGNGGCGKSHLIKTINHSVSKLFLYQSGRPVKPRVLVLAPTGVAAININGTTIDSGLNIPCRGKLMPLSDKNRAGLRNKYSKVQIVIIDKISMVSGKLLYQIHKRLNEIFSPQQDIPFGGKWVLVCGDLYQLPPVQAKPAFMFNETETSEGFLMLDLWHKFKLAELTETMHQKGDTMFTELLNKIRVGVVDVSVDYILIS